MRVDFNQALSILVGGLAVLVLVAIVKRRPPDPPGSGSSSRPAPGQPVNADALAAFLAAEQGTAPGFQGWLQT